MFYDPIKRLHRIIRESRMDERYVIIIILVLKLNLLDEIRVEHSTTNNTI